MNRRYSASDVRRFARCRRQWWYETRADELATLEPAEIERRLAELRRHFGRRAASMPAYQLLVDLAVRQGRLAYGTAAHRRHAARVAARRSGCLFAAMLALLIGGALAGLLTAATRGA